MTPANAASVGTPVSNAVLTLQDGSKVSVGAGFYLTREEARRVAQGIVNMKADLGKLVDERDAYKEAYEKACLNGDILESAYKSLYDKYQKRVDETNQMIKDYEEKIKLTEIREGIAKKDARVYRTLSFVELVVIGLIIL